MIRLDTIIARGSKYLSRIRIGNFRVHYFHRGDQDRDPHDHPFDYWTLPIGRGYVEEYWPKPTGTTVENKPKLRYVAPWRVHFRPHWNIHKVHTNRPVLTLVWIRWAKYREWGFYVPSIYLRGKLEYVSSKEYFGE